MFDMLNRNHDDALFDLTIWWNEDFETSLMISRL